MKTHKENVEEICECKHYKTSHWQRTGCLQNKCEDLKLAGVEE